MATVFDGDDDPVRVRLGYDDIGSGLTVLVLHGAYSTRDEVRVALEPVFAQHPGVRRLYVDLPGHGDSSAPVSITSSADVLDRLDVFVAEQVGDAPFAVVGHSFGGHLARGLAARHPGQALGIGLLCPLLPDAMGPEPHEVVVTEGDPFDDLDPASVEEYRSYFVVHTPATAQRFNEAVVPTLGRYDGATVERIMEGWDVPTGPFSGEVLVLTGRHDSVVGFREQLGLVDQYPHATYAVVADAGHALPHERPDVVAEALGVWLARLGPRP